MVHAALESSEPVWQSDCQMCVFYPERMRWGQNTATLLSVWISRQKDEFKDFQRSNQPSPSQSLRCSVHRAKSQLHTEMPRGGTGSWRAEGSPGQEGRQSPEVTSVRRRNEWKEQERQCSIPSWTTALLYLSNQINSAHRKP